MSPFIYSYDECCCGEFHYAECPNAVCHFAECHYAECHYAECRYAECRYVESRYAECRYAECNYAECRGPLKSLEANDLYTKCTLLMYEYISAKPTLMSLFSAATIKTNPACSLSRLIRKLTQAKKYSYTCRI